MAVVIDASAAAALVFGEPAADEVRRQLAGHALFAPRLLDYELANVAWKKLRHVPGAGVAILAALVEASRLKVTHSDPDMTEVLPLAVATGLTPYDASYLWLARQLRLPLITLDAALARAAAAL
ncbi:MAG: type II toxin-antitoxin system VapC family toxin [Vicinamibacterales bacterium]